MERAAYGPLPLTGGALDILWRHRLLILAFLLLGWLVGGAACRFVPPRYRATCRMEINWHPTLSTIPRHEQRRASHSRRARLAVERQVVILKSPELHEQVWKRMNKRWAEKFEGEPPVPTVTVNRLPEADQILDVHVDAAHGDYAKDFLDTLLEVHELVRMNSEHKAADIAQVTLSTERQKLDAELDLARRELADYVEKHRLASTTLRDELEEEYLRDLVRMQTEIRLRRTMLEGKVEALESFREPGGGTFEDKAEFPMPVGDGAATVQSPATLGQNTDAARSEDADPSGNAPPPPPS